MNTTLTRLCAGASLACLLTAQAKAAEKTPTAPAKTAAVATVASAEHHHLRASTLEGFKVYNSAGDELGKINDLVIDLQSGKITYAALDFGGFLGVGDKLFAVPWSAFMFSSGGKERHLTLDVPKDKLKNAPGFDKNHWPDMADPAWATPVDKFYDAHKTAAVR